MKIIVTGSAGFIGSFVALRLLQRGDTVVGIDNINSYYDPSLKYARLAEAGISKEAEQWHTAVQSTKFPNYRFYRMNLEDKEQLMKLFEAEKFDKVCHLAAQAGVRYSLENPYAYVDSNLYGFVSVLEACRHHNIKHLVYASSSSVYGKNTKMPLSIDHFVDNPVSLYAATKKCNELMAHTYSYLFGLPTTGLRFFTVYGPWGRPDMALFLFTKAILEKRPIRVFNNGNMIRDFTYIDDIVEGVIRVIDNPPATDKKYNRGMESKPFINGMQLETPYKLYNIGNSSPVRLMDYIAAIENHLDRKAKKIYLPMQPGDVPRTEADVKELEKDLGYKPDTPVVIGIGRFIKWYKSFYNVRTYASRGIKRDKKTAAHPQ